MTTSTIVGAARGRRPCLFVAALAVLAALAAAPAAEKAAAKPAGAKAGAGQAAAKAGDQNAAKTSKARKLAPGEKFLREAAVKLENFTFGAADLAAAGRHARQAKALAERLPFDLVVARYQREYQDRPDRAAAEVLPHLFDKDTVAAWEKATAQLRKEAPKPGAAKAGKTTKGKDAGTDAADDAAPGAAAPLAPLPPAGEWKLTADNAPAAVEVAACLAAAGQMAEALSVIDRVGADFADANRVCAAELAGDLNVRNATYSRAIEFYQYGIDFLNHSLGTENQDARNDDGSYAKEYSEYEQALRARLCRKRDAAQRRLEADRYGDDWTLYRDAERARRERGDFLSAYLLYEELIAEYPETVYAEAGRCYRIKTLLDLADRHHAANVQKTLKGQDKAIAAMAKLLQNAKAAKACKPVLSKLQARLDAAQARKERLLAVPLGEKAEKAANAAAGKFLAENEFGLYRGEVLYHLGNHALECEFDAAKADKILARAVEWFAKAKTIDADLARFAVPGKAAGVAAPPPTMRNRDVWGNLGWSFPEPGQLFNRRDSTWYADYHRMMASTKRALTRFILGDKKTAQELIKVIIEVDAEERALAEKGWPNSYYRFRDEFEDGSLFATKEDLKHFKGKMKTQLMVADYYYEIEQWEEARKRYRQFYSEHWSKLDVTARAYLDLMLGYTSQHGPDADKAVTFAYFNKFTEVKEYYATPSWERAMLWLATYYQNDPKTHYKSIAVRKKVIAKQGKTRDGWGTTVDLGIFYYAWNRYDEAVAVFDEVLAKCKEEDLLRAARICKGKAIKAKSLEENKQ